MPRRTIEAKGNKCPSGTDEAEEQEKSDDQTDEGQCFRLNLAELPVSKQKAREHGKDDQEQRDEGKPFCPF